METKIDFLRWLSIKLCLTNAAMYATVGVSMTLPYLLVSTFALPQPISSIIAFLVISLVRAFFESLIIYETPFDQLSLPKLLTLSTATAITMTVLLSHLKIYCGNFAIPVAVIISRKIVGVLKSVLWQNTKRPTIFAELAAKTILNVTGTYYFFGILVGITYTAYGIYGFNFEYIFPTAFFIGMICEELYALTNVYEIKPNIQTFIKLIFWTIICAISSTAIVIAMMQWFGFSGQAATITSIILIKSIQPLGSLKFVLGLSKKENFS